MKKIRKINVNSAQSIMSFACPCIDGNCSSCTVCGCGSSAINSQTAYSAAKTSISTYTMHGTQTINYR